MKKIGIVAFAFGAPAYISSNESIAGIAINKARLFNAPIYTQRDVRIEHGVGVDRLYTNAEKGDSPPPTLRMARGAVDWAQRNELNKLWIVAAKPHLWRCMRDLTQAVRESKTAIAVHFCREIEQYPEDSWFCSNSTQKRTQSRKNWESRERILKFLPFFIYKLIAN